MSIGNAAISKGHYNLVKTTILKFLLHKALSMLDFTSLYNTLLYELSLIKGIFDVWKPRKGLDNYILFRYISTKRLSTFSIFSSQVAIHSVVEKLFRSIWTLPNNKVPVAIKYFFDFLDAQAENKKITDPDVVHIWKTNRYVLMYVLNIKPKHIILSEEHVLHLKPHRKYITA